MKIAFTSCFHAVTNPVQPIWSRIAAAQPDVLVLLGDSIYLDVDNGYSVDAIQKLDAYSFAQLAFAQYRKQLAVSDFATLLRRPGIRTYAIWDDHDCMYNNVCGAVVASDPRQADKIGPSRALFAAFRASVESGLATKFPIEIPGFVPAPPEPGYRAISLAPDLVLHLTDGRSYKTRSGKAALLGSAQMALLGAQLQAKPDALHLVASGVVFDNAGESWAKCAAEHDQMLRWAAQYKILMLSGDIHKNDFQRYPNTDAPGRKLFNAVSSGAAIRGVLTGFSGTAENWGLLTLDAATARVQTFTATSMDHDVTVQRASWG